MRAFCTVTRTFPLYSQVRFSHKKVDIGGGKNVKMPTFGMYVLCTYIFGIYVVWLPHFRDIRGMATFFTGVFFTVAGVSPSSWEASSAAPLDDATMLRWVRSRNVYRPRTGGDRRDRWRMLMKRLLLYTTTGCGGSRRLAAANPPSYRIISLLEY